MPTPVIKGARQQSRIMDGITSIRVRGYKSISNEQSIEIKPLTVLAGANSSGKSSIMQPLLLLKQSLEASYDPGALLLDGPNLKFTSADQLLSRPGKKNSMGLFSVGLQVQDKFGIETDFTKDPSKGFVVSRTAYSIDKDEYELTLNSTSQEIKRLFKGKNRGVSISGSGFEYAAVRVRCFLKIALKSTDGNSSFIPYYGTFPFGSKSLDFERYITQMIHIPGLRGNPLRTYPVSAFGSSFQGTFEKYSASVIAQWQAEKQKDILELLFSELRLLGLTWKVTAKPINETQVEWQVGRLPQPVRGGARDWVSIADVGFGVSQTLPVLVALHVAQPGQLASISTAGFLAPEIVPVCSRTPCFKGFP